MPNTETELRLVNKSQHILDTEFVIFQKNYAAESDAGTIAWRVIRNLGVASHHTFEFGRLELGVAKTFRHHSSLMRAKAGDAFRAYELHGGVVAVSNGKSADPATIEVLNNRPEEPISAQCFRDGIGLAIVDNIASGHRALFDIRPEFFIGGVTYVEQGAPMTEKMINYITAKFSIEGVASADIIISGGADGQPFDFAMENVEMW